MQDIENEILKYYKALRRDCKEFSSSGEMKSLGDAFRFISEVCREKPERWGKPTVFHALEIARIVANETGLGGTSVIAAMLSEYVDNEKYAISDIRDRFGDKVAEILEGLLKISAIKTDKSITQAENLRNLILTMASDIRVILIKLAERLYLMRNLNYIPLEDRIILASETSYIYAPLAHRMGLYNMMSEMEDLTMKYVEPEIYSLITEKLKATDNARNKSIKKFIKPIVIELEKQGLKAEIKARVKAVSSIWRKMKRQKVEFEEIYDIFAVRIILDSVRESEKADCWKVYSIITDIYQPNPDRMRDWISVPKSNGYESLHSTVVVPGGEWVEIQIRSKRMDEIAEKGLAAHWKYKGIRGEKGVDDWLRKVREHLESPEADAAQLLDDLKLNFYSKEIFVFTPLGDLKKFPEGATVLDFAFDIHSAVGASCIGAKINGRNVPIRHKLKNGDKVEILRSKNQTPNPDWLNYVATSKAKSKIKVILKEAKMKDAERGKEILKRRFKNWKLEFQDPNIRKLIRHYKLKDSIDLYSDVAKEKLDLLEIKSILTEQHTKEEPKQVSIQEDIAKRIIRPQEKKADDCLIIDNKLINIDYHLGKCCNPIFGDAIFGFVTRTDGITIHRINCPNAPQLISRYGYRVVKAKWTQTETERYFLSALRIIANDEIGILSNISDVISKEFKINVRSFVMDSGDGVFEGTLHLFVKNIENLEFLIKRLQKVKGVLTVKRIEG